MPALERYTKQAEQLVRWHREGNRSVGGRIRRLPRYAALTDLDVLALAFTPAEAQEVIALEAGCVSWDDLAARAETRDLPRDAPATGRPAPTKPSASATPVLFVADVAAASAFYRDRLGFRIDFLHGDPPFYGSVSRHGATIHLKFVHAPVFAPGAVDREGLIMAFIQVSDVRAVHAEYRDAGVEIVQEPTEEAWGGTDLIVEDLDDNRIAFVG